ncbi:MAG: SpoIIE family protein phosphatase [Microscillaceae bacterium]|nr:SpoIIE family protein phosphatase [Microscillaceae bacterium]
MHTEDDDELLFADEANEEEELLFAGEEKAGHEGKDEMEAAWHVMIVDDEEEIHTVTRFALSDYKYKGKKLRFLNAFTGAECIEYLKNKPDIALILLDVVMETNDAGLRTVSQIREELGNHFVRIVMRTGQPGQAPEEEVILKYDINDYKNKTELTDKKLFTTITTSLRSYADIMEIESYRLNLEQKVEERTAEVVKAKEIIERKNQDITSSINYAKRIQEAMMPPLERIQYFLPESFILFRPRDIVSGDFYWFTERDGKILISAIDCTGHGVPGAFMSMVGDAHLNQIVNVDGITNPDVILTKLHQRVRQSLKQAETQNRDGMDMALCAIDPYRKLLEFAGAKNSMIYIQDHQAFQIKGDRHPIGGEQKEAQRVFQKQILPLDRPTTVYMFSDGYPDQFGGSEDRKFMVKRLRDLLLEIHQKPFSEQHDILAQTFEEWKGAHKKQTDDMIVVGFRVSF